VTTPFALVIEDHLTTAEFFAAALNEGGFETEIIRSGQGAIDRLSEIVPDMIILDLNLPGMDGLDIAREIHRKSDTPIIMLTARVEETDRLIGLELGADDYITKPFSPREVVARVKAVLRRVSKSKEPVEIIRISDLEIDLEAHSVQRSSELIELTPTEFDILKTLAEYPGKVFSRLQLLEASQGNAYEGYERTIDAHIKNLRAKLEPDPKNPRYVETVFGVGYRVPKSPI